MSTETFTVVIDYKMRNTLHKLKNALGKTSIAEVFRLAIALLTIAVEAVQRDEIITITDAKGGVSRQIIIPSKHTVEKAVMVK
jgi:hypothetical protein